MHVEDDKERPNNVFLVLDEGMMYKSMKEIVIESKDQEGKVLHKRYIQADYWTKGDCYYYARPYFDDYF